MRRLTVFNMVSLDGFFARPNGESDWHNADEHHNAFAVERLENTDYLLPQMRLELVLLPVADVDGARDFYVEKLGFHLDHDVQPSETMRVVQLTPPGSVCSIVVGTGKGGGVGEMAPGTVKGLHLVVDDVKTARHPGYERGGNGGNYGVSRWHQIRRL